MIIYQFQIKICVEIQSLIMFWLTKHEKKIWRYSGLIYLGFALPCDLPIENWNRKAALTLHKGLLLLQVA